MVYVCSNAVRNESLCFSKNPILERVPMLFK